MYLDDDDYQHIKSVIPIACVDLVIEKNNSILLVKRKNPPAKGQWWTPGGRILKDETIRDASIRKAKEKVGLDCLYVDTIGVTETIFDEEETHVHTVNILCAMELCDIHQKVVLDDDHESYIWKKENSTCFHPAVQKVIYLSEKLK